jgi:hypothetical protein
MSGIKPWKELLTMYIRTDRGIYPYVAARLGASNKIIIFLSIGERTITTEINVKDEANAQSILDTIADSIERNKPILDIREYQGQE